MNREKFYIKWVKYLLRRDSISKVALSVSAIGILVWYFLFRNDIFLIIVGALFAVSVLYSLLSYLLVGIPRISKENRFYDSIRFDCDFPSEYSGREMNRIRFLWKGLKVQEIVIQAASKSRMMSAKGIWRSAKSSIIDVFSPRGSILVDFSQQSQGILRFKVYNKSEIETDSYKNALSLENLYAFVYDELISYNQPIPRFSEIIYVEGMLSHLRVDIDRTIEKYSIKQFENNFKQKYQNANNLWTFTWDSTSVTAKAIQRGTIEERKLAMEASIINLVDSAFNASFYLSATKEIVFTKDMILWNSDMKSLESLTIDFTQTDLSRPETIEKFEKLLQQGLYQYFKKTEWTFNWNIEAFEKLLFVVADHHHITPRTQEENLVKFPELDAIMPKEDPLVIPIINSMGLPPRPTREKNK